MAAILFLSGLTERNELIPETSGALAVLEKPISRARWNKSSTIPSPAGKRRNQQHTNR
jgi:hypothetical protein